MTIIFSLSLTHAIIVVATPEPAVGSSRFCKALLVPFQLSLLPITDIGKLSFIRYFGVLAKGPIMKTVSRRDAMGVLAAAGVGAITSEHLVSGVGATQSQTAATSQTVRAFSAQHQPKPLPFDPAKLRGISEKLIKSHWENNYTGAVKALNAIEQRLIALLQDKELPPFVYGNLKREELVRTGSVVLHENYFGNLGGDGKASGKAVELIKQWFGSYEQWEMEFKKIANALAGGSGWVVLAYNLHTREVHNYWAWDHMHSSAMGYPLLVLDMYEHAYHMDYGAAAAKYIDAFMQNVNWDEVSRRAEQVQQFR